MAKKLFACVVTLLVAFCIVTFFDVSNPFDLVTYGIALIAGLAV